MEVFLAMCALLALNAVGAALDCDKETFPHSREYVQALVTVGDYENIPYNYKCSLYCDLNRLGAIRHGQFTERMRMMYAQSCIWWGQHCNRVMDICSQFASDDEDPCDMAFTLHKCIMRDKVDFY